MCTELHNTRLVELLQMEHECTVTEAIGCSTARAERDSSQQTVERERLTVHGQADHSS